MPPTLDPNTKVPVVPPRTYHGAKRGRKPRNNESTTTPLSTPSLTSGAVPTTTTTASATSTPTTATAYRPPATPMASGSIPTTTSYSYQTPPLKLAPPHVQVGSSAPPTSTSTTPNPISYPSTPTPTPASASTTAATAATTITTTSVAATPTSTTATTAPAIPTTLSYYTTPGTATTSYAHYYSNPSVLPPQYNRPPPVPVSVSATTTTAGAAVAALQSSTPTPTTTTTTTTTTTAPSSRPTPGTAATTTTSVPLALPLSSSNPLSTASYTPTAGGYTYTPSLTPGTTPPTYLPRYSLSGSHTAHPVIALSPAATAAAAAAQSQILRAAGATGAAAPIVATPGIAGSGAVVGATATAMDEDEEGEEHELPFMSDDVYGQGLLWQSQSKENLKVLMDHFTPEQFERYEAYRRSAFQKQSVRKVIQQATPYTISQPVAQVVAGFAKVFVGEIIEKARKVQERYNAQDPPSSSDAGPEPLSPEHIREAYRLYQLETGKIGAARVHKGRKLFVR